MNSKRLSRIIDKALDLAKEVIEEVLLNEEEEEEHDDKSRDLKEDRTTPVHD